MRTERTQESNRVFGRLLLGIAISRFAGLIVLTATMMFVQAGAETLPSYIEKPVDAAGVYAIYPGSGVPPGSEKWTWHEQSIQAPGSSVPNRMVRNVVIPTVTMFSPAPGTANGTAMIVAPGGAFTFLMVDYEGYDMARWLAKRGVTAFVLRYRVANSPEKDSEFFPFVQNLMTVLPHPDAKVETPPTGTKAVEQARTWGEEDGRQAVRFVRQHSAEWGIDPHRIGIGGFSAGGGVTMGAVMQHDDESRPDFAVPVYAGYRTATPVPADAPPLFIAATNDDVLVAPISGARIYEEWHKAGKPAELHIFVKGQHGFGMKKQNLPSDAWINLLETWLANEGFLPTTDASAGSHP
jgi:acetyl esterase/lipase